MEDKEIKTALQEIISIACEIAETKYGNLLSEFNVSLPSLGLKRVVIDDNDVLFAFSLFHRVAEIEYAIFFRCSRIIVYTKSINIDPRDYGDNIGVLCKVINENIKTFTPAIKNICKQAKEINNKVNLNDFQCFSM